MTRSVAVLATLLGAACAAPPDDVCEARTTTAAVQAADRKIIGAGAHYPADATLRGREQELRRSQKLRRQVAWDTVAKVLAPVALATELPKAPSSSLPAWQSWYGRDDLNRLFNRLYEAIGPERRARRSRFTDAELDDALAWNLRAVDELPNWPAERWQDYLDAIDQAAEVPGVAGIAPVGYSPATARHLLESYPEILACMDQAPPPAFVDGPADGERRVVREPFALGRCGVRRFGPYFATATETLRATLGDVGAGGRLSVSDDTGVRCEADDTDACHVEGPGRFYVSVTAGPDGADGNLEVDYLEAQPTWASCLRSAFPVDAVATKAHWRRAQLGITMPTYSTSAAAISARLAAEGGASWGDGDGQADPDPGSIHTIALPNGNVFRLAALHLTTKELDHWLWITLWWSDDPDSDFGADRPASIADLGGPWANYKMCVTSLFDEGDPDPTGGFGDLAPSLAEALAATYGGPGAPSWCSNPYIELGAGNAASNCIGCHQHGGTGLTSEAVLADPDAFPAHGRTRLRNNFPHDYSFAIDAGDRLGRLFADVVEYYDGFE